MASGVSDGWLRQMSATVSMRYVGDSITLGFSRSSARLTVPRPGRGRRGRSSRSQVSTNERTRSNFCAVQLSPTTNTHTRVSRTHMAGLACSRRVVLTS